MRTFSHFPTDDREHRLLGMAVDVPQPSDALEALQAPESLEQTIELPEIQNAAMKGVEAADADMNMTKQAMIDAAETIRETEVDIINDPSIARAEIDVSAALNQTADLIDRTGATVQQGTERVSGFIRSVAGATATPVEVKLPSVDPYTVDPTKISNEEEQGRAPFVVEPPKSETKTGLDDMDIARYRTATGPDGPTKFAEAPKPSPDTTEEPKESKETPSDSYEREKDEQRKGREDKKLADVSAGNRNQWSTIDHGKTDGTGTPFLYKEGTKTVNGQEQRVLLAYSPNGGVQVMDINTHEWTYMNDMSPAEQAQLKGAEGMNQKAHEAALAAEKKKDPEAFQKRMEQHERNFTMEERCLRNNDASATWFEANKDAAFWKGNEDVRDALAAALKNPDATDKGKNTPAETDEDPKEKSDIAKLTKTIEDMQKKMDAMAARLDQLEGGDGKLAEGPKEGANGKDVDKDAEKDQAIADAEKVLENPSATAAERAEAVKILTDAALDELNSPAQRDDVNNIDIYRFADYPKINRLDDTPRLTESDKKLRSRLIAEVRNAEPKKLVADVKSEKEAAYKAVQVKSYAQIYNSNNTMRTQSVKVDDIRRDITNLKEQLSAAPEEGKGAIQTKITAAEQNLTTAEENLRTMEANHETYTKTLETARSRRDAETKMLDTLEAEWNTTAQKTEAKFESMGTTLISLGDSATGRIVQGLDVKHDGSFGLTMTGADTLVETLTPFLKPQDRDDLTKNDHPAPALRGIAALIKSLEVRGEVQPIRAAVGTEMPNRSYMTLEDRQEAQPVTPTKPVANTIKITSSARPRPTKLFVPPKIEPGDGALL